ncbi:uncharacterized protein EI90DRAFT_2965783 [Cantharellus anzutake]|uniref:uncharacterized protein n=1 Tax=Cantharellus anzutake TaxID=1750568 RepID=UPI0019051CCB|nr:uncharacterized protein EI90DRAFT_2965783 [Cantharellus anzutake]KAF8341415.1 hypothetical protein EI90DRAFT_2965783 [Cantharellus anzutake]
MRSWLGWSMFTAHYETLSEGQKVHIESIIKMIEKRAGAEISEHPPHGTPHLTPLRISLDPLNVENRPAIVYAVVNLAGFGALRWYEWRHGVQYGTIGGLDYLIRIPSGPLDMPRGDEDRTPILFLHGVGVGLVQHLVFINNILSDTTLANRIVLIPIQPHISQTIFHPNHIHPPRKDEILRDLRLLIYMACSIAGFENRPQVTVLSHSNGTSLHAWLLKSNPELIFRSCFVDPVIFCLWEGGILFLGVLTYLAQSKTDVIYMSLDVCYNFVYKAPSNGVEALSKYFVASEMGIANYIQRNWDWSANTLFFQEIPHPHDAYRTRIFLSGRDQIVSAKRVRRYFAFHGLTDVDSKTVFVHEGATHAEAMFLGGAGLRFIVNWLKATGIGSLSGMEDFQDEKVGRSTYPVRLDDERQYS